MDLNFLKKALELRKPAGTERRRILADMAVYAGRISCGEYSRARFVTNTLNIKERTIELLDDLEFLHDLGQGWKRIFKSSELTEQSTVLDLGSGALPKIELGLHYSGFKGSVQLLDMDRQSLAGASRFLKFLNPSFRYTCLTGNVWQLGRKKYDLVCANHFLDDLLLSDYCQQKRISLAKCYSSEEFFIKVWAQIPEKSGFIENTAALLADKLSARIRTRGFLCLLDYPSHSHVSMGLDSPWKTVRALRVLLKAELKQQGFSEIRVAAFKGVRGVVARVPADSLLLMQKP